jgi:hypothetical protein
MLKNMVRIAACLCALAGSGRAIASGDVSGVIQGIDIPARRLVLDGERAYPVVRGINLAKLKLGDMVTVRTEDRKGKDLITKITKGDHFSVAPLQQHSHIPRL